MIIHLPDEHLQYVSWPTGRVWPSVIMQQVNTGISIPRHLIWMPRRNFFIVSQKRSAFTVSPLVRKSTRRMPRLSQNTVHITFHVGKVCLNFVLQGDPLWRHCIECCMVSVLIRFRNSSPPSLCSYRNANADSMFISLYSGVDCFGTHLAHNFLNNRCSVTMLCNKERGICGKWLLSSVIVKWRFSIIQSHTRWWMISHCAPLHAHVVDLLQIVCTSDVSCACSWR